MSGRLVRYMIEAVLGFLVACVVILVLAVTVETVPFVYQGY